MKRFIIIASLAGMLVACGEKTDKQALEEQIREYKNEISTLTSEMNELQAQLDTMSTDGDRFKVPVQVHAIQPKKFTHYFQVNGQVDAANNAQISPETGGQIKEILVTEGQRVSKGQVLVRLNTEVTQNSIEEVKTSLELAEKVFEKQKNLWEQEIGSEIQYLQAKNNKESLERRLETLESQLDMSIIKAPFSGVVDDIFQKTGELSSPGVPILHLVNLSQMRIEANIAETYLPHIAEGDTVSIHFPSYTNYHRKATIKRISEVIDPESRTFTIEMWVSNPDRRMKPNLMAIVRVNDFRVDSAMVVPDIVVKEDREGTYLYRAVEENGQWLARKTYVTPGKSYNNTTMITQGINFGDRVIVAGYDQVSNNSEVTIK